MVVVIPDSELPHYWYDEVEIAKLKKELSEARRKTAEEVLDLISDKIPDCTHVTRDNKRCCMCDGCSIWAFWEIDISEPIEDSYGVTG